MKTKQVPTNYHIIDGKLYCDINCKLRDLYQFNLTKRTYNNKRNEIVKMNIRFIF